RRLYPPEDHPGRWRTSPGKEIWKTWSLNGVRPWRRSVRATERQSRGKPHIVRRGIIGTTSTQTPLPASQEHGPAARRHSALKHMTFKDRLDAAWAHSNSMLMVGLDPDPSRFPAEIQGRPDAIFEFCREIVDATAP